MKKLLAVAALCFAFALPALAAGVKISDLPAAASVTGTNLFECSQSAVSRKCTATQIAAFINGLVSGDCTATGPGVYTCTKLNGVSPGTAFSINTGTSGHTLPFLDGINTWSAKQTFGAVAFGGITGSTQCLHVDTSGNLSGVAADCGTVTSVAAGCGTSTGGSPITTTGTVLAALTSRINTATSGAGADFVSTDCGNTVFDNSASSIAIVLPQAGTTGFATGTFFERCNINTGVATITPTTSAIGGASTLAVPGGTAAAPVCYTFQSDGTNYKIVDSPTINAALLIAGTIPSARLGFGSGVFTAAAAALSAAGGLTTTVGSGTKAMATSAIGSAACTSAQTVTVTGTLTTDVVLVGFNGDPTAVTGFVPLTAGMLTVIAYPTADTVNIKECNNTTSSVTPGAHTLNVRVVR